MANKKNEVLIKKSKLKGYVQVHMSYLMEEFNWIKKNTTLRGRDGTTRTSPNIQMVDHLLIWMGSRKKPWWKFLTNETEWKQWVTLREDHWLMNHDVKAELIAKKLI